MIRSSRLVKTLTSAGLSAQGVAIDGKAKLALIEMLVPGGSSSLQLLDLETQSFLPVSATATVETSGSFSPYPEHDLILFAGRPNQNLATNPQILDLSDPMNPAVYEFADDSGIFSGADNLHSVAAECSTGIVLASDESRARVFIADLSQVTFSSTKSEHQKVWSAPAQFQDLPELSAATNGTTGVSIASGTHLAILEGDSGSSTFAAVRLPSAAGHGVPSVQDWVVASMPDDPSGAPWETARHPDAVAAYVSPNTDEAVGLVVNERRKFIARVDIEALLNATRTGEHTLSASVDLVGSGIVSFVPIP
ncbi:MAG: hypothetical protein ACLQAT_13600 [Candidatus Binataceae bacterium]